MAIVVQHPAIAQAQQGATAQEMPVGESKFIQHAKYDPATLQLTVTMRNGAQYIHFYVFPAVWEQWTQAPSKGKFYAEVIRGKHPATRVITKTVGTRVAKTNKKEGAVHGKYRREGIGSNR